MEVHTKALRRAGIIKGRECRKIMSRTAALTTLSILDAVQRRAIRLIGDPALTCHLQPLSHQRIVGDLSLFYRYSNGFCSSELTSIIPPLSKRARCTRKTSSSHPRAVVLHTSRTERYDHTFVPSVSRAWNGLPENLSWSEHIQHDVTLKAKRCLYLIERSSFKGCHTFTVSLLYQTYVRPILSSLDLFGIQSFNVTVIYWRTFKDGPLVFLMAPNALAMKKG
nr:unnamed protein product [Callosobruchus chinensis]